MPPVAKTGHCESDKAFCCSKILNEKACQAVTVRINSFRSDNRQGQRVSARHICDMCGGPLSTPRQAWCKEVLACGSNVFFSGAPPCADHAHEVVTRGSKATRSFLFLTANSGAPGRGSPMPTPVARALGDFSPGSSSEESPFRFYH